MSNIRGAMFTGGSSENFIREKDDFYATHPNTTNLFFNRLHKDMKLEGNILECACGCGHMSEVIKNYYPDNLIMSTDLVDRGYGQGGIDFLKHEYKENFNVIITNPPFKLAKEFVERALELSTRYTIMLMKIQFLESISRKEFLENSPLKFVYIHSSRQACMMEGLELNPRTGKAWSSPMMLAWFVWDKSYNGEPIIKWI